MYIKIDIKNITLAVGLQYKIHEHAKLFRFDWYYNNEATQIGITTITHKLTMGIRYENQRIKMATQHQSIKKRLA